MGSKQPQDRVVSRQQQPGGRGERETQERKEKQNQEHISTHTAPNPGPSATEALLGADHGPWSLPIQDIYQLDRSKGFCVLELRSPLVVMVVFECSIFISFKIQNVQQG